jgi:hypothetical protein
MLTMSIEAVPPRQPTALDVMVRPAVVEIRPAPIPGVTFMLTYQGLSQCGPLTPSTPNDDDPPRMQRMLATTTSTGINIATTIQSYDDCSRVAVVTGQPYAVDIRVWGAESNALVERMNHDYSLQSYCLSRGKGWKAEAWTRLMPGDSK